MKKLVLLFLFINSWGFSQSITIDPQAGGTGIINAQSTATGIMIPKMTSNERTNITAPSKGLLVFDTTSNSFWYFNGTIWAELSAGGTGEWETSGNNLQSANTGNVGIGINPSKSKFEVSNMGANQAIFGSNGAGISLQQNHPTIGFNQYRDIGNVQRYIGNGYAMGVYFNQTNAAMYWTAMPTGLAGNPTASETNLMTLNVNGDLGIGTPTPQAKLHVEGYSKLGENSPKIKLKSLTGTIPCLSNNCTDNIPHGLDATKILDISILIENQESPFKHWAEPANCTSLNFGYCYYYSFDATNIVIRHPNSGTANTLGKPYKILITYQE